MPCYVTYPNGDKQHVQTQGDTVILLWHILYHFPNISISSSVIMLEKNDIYCQPSTGDSKKKLKNILVQPGLVACVKRVDTCWSSFRHKMTGVKTVGVIPYHGGKEGTLDTLFPTFPNISQPLRHLSDTFSYWPAASADRVRGAFWAIRDPSKTPIPKSSEAAKGENRGKSQDGWNCEIKSFQILFGLIGSSNHKIFPDWMFGFIKLKMLKSVNIVVFQSSLKCRIVTIKQAWKFGFLPDVFHFDQT